MKIIPLSEGSFTVDKTKQFIPFDIEKDNLQERTVGSLLVEIQPFVVITSKDVLLLDTGLGFAEEGMMQIHKNLKANGIEPSSVTKVLMSHLHKDHSGGMSYKKNGQRLLSFPGAVYYINKGEFDFAFQNPRSSYVLEDLEILRSAPQVQLMNDSGTIDDYIRYEVTGAHSPHHQVFWIEEDGDIVFFGGDVVPQLQQLKNRFIAKYDFDGRRSMELRQEWKEKGERENWKFLFYHDIKTPVFSFASQKKGLP